jgi:hypothetical protein
MKRFALFYLIALPIIADAQKKGSSINNYWIASNISLLFDTDYKGTGIGIEAGRYLKKGIAVGMGYNFLQLNNTNKVNVLQATIEKSIGDKKSKLFFFAKPGIAFAKNQKLQTTKYTNLEYYKSKAGFNLQVGSGIRWMINRHSYFLNAGYNFTNYTLYTKEYQSVPVDPYNPFFEDAVVHTYKLNFTKLIISIGFTL